MSSTARRVFKYSLRTLLCLVFIYLIWLGFVTFHDEPPDSGRDDFYQNTAHKIPDNQNVAIAISGIKAPPDIDTIKYGRFVRETFDSTENSDEAKRLSEVSGSINFIGSREEFECWVDEEIQQTTDNCASKSRIKELVVKNQLLLDRYYKLYTLPNWEGWSGNGQVLINLNRLIVAEIKVEISEGQDQKAYAKWRNNFEFISRTLGQETGVIDHAIFLVLEGFSLVTLEHLIATSPQIVGANYEDLNNLLKHPNLKRYNLTGMLKAEYRFFNQSLFKTKPAVSVHPEFIRNRIYRFHLDYLSATEKPPSALESNFGSLRRKYSLSNINNAENLQDPINTSLVSTLLNGAFKSSALIESMYNHIAQIKILNLEIMIKRRKLEPKHIQDFLNTAGSEFFCPYTMQPMIFDISQKVIYCENPTNQNRVAQVKTLFNK